MDDKDNPSAPPPSDDEVERVVAAGPHGAIAVAGVATLIVMAIWVGFYLFVFATRDCSLIMATPSLTIRIAATRSPCVPNGAGPSSRRD